MRYLSLKKQVPDYQLNFFLPLQKICSLFSLNIIFPMFVPLKLLVTVWNLQS